MRVVVTGDLHYGLNRQGDRSTRGLVENLHALSPDVLALCGDSFAQDIRLLHGCLSLFKDLRCVKLLVAGNHDIWATSRYDSLELYTRVIPEISAEYGFEYLDDHPYIHGNTGFAGSILWYDYSFRRPELNIPMQAYERKFFQGFLWYDVECIRWDLDDRTFTQYQLSKLENHLSHLECKVESIVAITHHVPFRNMIKIKNAMDWDFGNAFQGSELFGHQLLRYKKIKYLVCGHSHLEGQFQNEHIQCHYVGSSYAEKKYILLEF